MRTTASPKKAADPFDSLEQDHRSVEEMFRRLESSKAGPARWAIFLQIKDALGKHAVLEEHIVYPALRSCPTPEAQVAATQGYDEHEGIKGTLAEIEMTDPTDASFLGKCLQLKALVADHVEEEESQMFPLGRRDVKGKRLQDLGTRLESTRAEQASFKEQERAERASPQAPVRKR